MNMLLFRRAFVALPTLLVLGLVTPTVLRAQGLVADSTELRVLRQFYTATGGPTWHRNGGWLTGATLADVARWEGVRTDGQDVVGLELPHNNLRGALPISLGLLRGLRSISLWQNQLSGSLPAAWGNLQQLADISLQQNALTGPIPPEWSRLRQLWLLSLHTNALTGPVPAALSRLTRLQYLNLYANQFSGPIPDSLARLRRLRTLDMSVNQLTGPLPAALGQLDSLESLQLWQNAFADSIPAAWAGMRRLRILNMQQTSLIGRLPRELAQLTQLEVLGCYMNQLRGPIPTELSQLRRLWTLDLSYNQLSGPLPQELGRLNRLWKLSLQFNQLQGIVPDSLGQLRQLVELNLHNNQLSGSLPATLGRLKLLQRLSASNNGFSGPLPDSLTSCGALQTIMLDNNHLSGQLPANAAAWTQLVYLDLGSNLLTGALPTGLAQLPRLWYCALNRNRLTGTLPPSLGQQTSLQYLLLGDNRLSGTVPAMVLRAAATVQLQNNRFTRVAATTEVTLPVRLNLSGNQLDFGALEALATGPGQVKPVFLDVQDQRPITPADTQYVVQSTRPWVTRLVGGVHNHYQWQRRVGEQLWVPLFDAASVGGTSSAQTFDVDRVQLANMTEGMEGEYRVQVTNEWFPNTIIYSRGRYLSMVPYVLSRNEPVASSSPTLANQAPVDRTGAQDSINYVRTFTARTALTDPSQLRNAAVQDVQVNTTYLDGVGRSVQTVQHQASPSGRDVVQPLAYDALGRQPKQYLPYAAVPAAGAAGAYRPNALREQFGFYRTPTFPGIPATGIAYAETSFEASPLNRVLAQAAPGETWQLNAADNHAVHTVERPNHPEQDTVRRWLPGYGSDREDLLPTGVYAAGALWVSQITNEQGQISRSYTDPEGRVVLKQVSLGKVNSYTVGSGDTTRYYERHNWLSTYYVYDDFGRLRAVIPPLAEQRLRAHNWAVDGAGLERLLFRYHYDERGRLVEKKVPDQDGYTYSVYDKLDRPVLTQDVAQRARAEWTATKYDTLGRVVLTALVRRPNQTLAQLQAAATAAPARTERLATVAGPGGAYYTNRAWPVLNAADVVLSTTEYDSYDFDHNGTTDAHYLTQYDATLGQAGYQGAPDLRLTGQPTRTRTRVLGTAATAPGAWLTGISFFDERLRPIQLQSTNARAGQDVVTTQFDFVGKPLVTVTEHAGPNHAPITLRETFAYDPTGRLLETRQELDGRAPVTIAANSYNELGQLQQKHLGGDKAQTALQTVDYAYNIRGWLTRVNDAQLTPQSGQRPDLFGLELSYDHGFNTNQYNGNIAGQKWRTASDNIERAYGYRYDQLNRLLQGDFVARDAVGTWNAERDNYRFWAASYDANGNLLTMRRRGLVQEATRATPRYYGEIDNLRYRFQPPATSPDVASNRLLRVDDLAPVASTFGGQQPNRPDFQDGATTGNQQPDYAYDAAGSLIRDRNKDIDSISYNHLHLPIRIVWNNGNRLEFRYTAAGQKVAKLATPSGKTTVRTDYLGAWQYEGDSLRWLNTSEGRALRFVQRDAAGQPVTRYSNEYTIKDHLGNLRVAFRPGDKARHRATMEPGLADQEEAQFDYVRETRYETDKAAGGQFVSRLNAAVGKPLGPLKTLTVRKGDTLQIEAYGRYQQSAQNTNYIFSMLGFVTSLLQQPVASPAGEPHTSRPRALPFLGIGLAVVPQLVQLSNGVPKAYLRALVFNKDYLKNT